MSNISFNPFVKNENLKKLNSIDCEKLKFKKGLPMKDYQKFLIILYPKSHNKVSNISFNPFVKYENLIKLNSILTVKNLKFQKGLPMQDYQKFLIKPVS